MYRQASRKWSLYGYAAAQLIAKAYQKAVRLTKRSSSLPWKASPWTACRQAGDAECDHQLMLPMFFGITKASPQYDLPHCRQYYDNSWQGLLTNL